MQRNSTVLVPIRILNGEYNVRCPSNKVDYLLEVSKHLEEKMKKARDEGNVMSLDRIAIIAALNTMGEYFDTHNELLNQKRLNASLSGTFQTRLKKLKKRIDEALL